MSAAIVLALALAPASGQASALRPLVFTGSASEPTNTSATLNGSVDPNRGATTYYFQYGTSSSYGSQTSPASVGAGTQSVHVSATIGGLSAAMTYHFRLVAVNAGGTTEGQDRTFATKKIPLSLTLTARTGRELFGTPFSLSGALSGSGSANAAVVLQGNPFPYLAGFQNIAGPQRTDANGNFLFQVPGIHQTTQLRVSTLEAPLVNSPVAVEFVAVRVTLHSRRTGRGSYVRLYGTVTPAEPGALVGLQLIRRGHRPLGVATTLVTSATATHSRFSRVVHISRPGLYRAFVYVVNGAQVSNTSHPIRVG